MTGPEDLFEGVIAGEIRGRRYSFKVTVPRNETFRIKNIFEEHEYGPPEILQTKTDPVIVDVGANVGIFSLYMKSHFPEASIVCFEPGRRSLELLRKNTSSHSKITIHEAALSDFDGEAPLYLHTSNSGQHSLIGGGADYRGSENVRVQKASSVLPALGHGIDILKIDTEGSEVSILRDLGAGLSQVRCLMVEYHSEADRRAVDALMNDFYLLSVKAQKPGLGTAVYLAKALAGA